MLSVLTGGEGSGNVAGQVVARRPYQPVRMLPQDLGVALVVLLALTLGGLLRVRVDGNTAVYQDQNSPLRLSYPAHWISAAAAPAPDGPWQAQDPRTASAFKTTLTAESRELDPGNPPTLQMLIDRRIAQQGESLGYRLLSNTEATVGGAKAARLDYAYVVQPIDAPRRYALPVVVQAREYIVVARDRTYYITLAAPQDEFADAAARFDQIIEKARVQ